MLQGQIEALPCGAGNVVGLHPELEGRDGPARMGGGAGERETTIPPALIEDVLGSPGYGQLQGGQPFPLQSSATSHHSPVPPGPASPQQLEKKFGEEWYREEKRENSSRSLGTKGMEMKVASRFQDFSSQCPSVTASAGQAEEGKQMPAWQSPLPEVLAQLRLQMMERNALYQLIPKV